jgi:lysophospholipase L1-like esterase
VNSHYLRIPTIITGKNFNDSVSGAKVIDLAAQVTVANGQQPEYVTVLIGGNDVCTSSEATMTSVVDFGSRFEAAMRALATGSPNAKVYVLSIPDVYNLWATLKDNGSARFALGSLRDLPVNARAPDVDRPDRR